MTFWGPLWCAGRDETWIEHAEGQKIVELFDSSFDVPGCR